MLVPVFNHCWDLAPIEAAQLQRELAGRVLMHNMPGELRTVAGIDVSIKGNVAQARIVVMNLPDMTIIEHLSAHAPVSYPYVPGLLSFREAPVILDALAHLAHMPDVLMFDAQGYAHPRRLGLASHVGLLLDRPSIGCAKSRLCGTYVEPDLDRGVFSWLMDEGETIGAVVRTRARVRPVFISVGHRITLESAIDFVLRCVGRYRLPEPMRWAHHVAGGREP